MPSRPEHWRDSHYRIEGPAVAQMQAAFMDNWIKTTGKVLQGEPYFPALGHARAGPRPRCSVPLRLAAASSMLLMYLLAITASEKTIDLSASYFVPDELTRTRPQGPRSSAACASQHHRARQAH